MHWPTFQAATSTLNWLIFGFLFLQPVLKHRMLVTAREHAFQAIEDKRKSRVIALIHRQEVVNFLGIPVMQFFDIQDSEAVLRAIRLTPREMPIDLILHTPAGLNLAAEQVARALGRHPGKVTAFVPHYAMSGGTLLALAADELVMCSDAILGSLDPTIGQYPAAALLAVAEAKKPDEMADSTFLMIDQARKAISQTQRLLTRVFAKRMPEEAAAKLAFEVMTARWTPDYPLSVDELRTLGITVSTDMPEDVLRLMNLFPQQSRRTQSVDFIQLPYTLPPAAPQPAAPSPPAS